MSYENILVEIDGPVATVTLNRPERLNALSQGLLSDLEAALRELNPGDDVRVIRLRGAGRAFCSGYDLRGGGGRGGGARGDSATEPEPKRQRGDPGRLR
jgi:enoyl-CoA hydratase/carnithine racemase